MRDTCPAVVWGGVTPAVRLGWADPCAIRIKLARLRTGTGGGVTPLLNLRFAMRAAVLGAKEGLHTAWGARRGSPCHDSGRWTLPFIAAPPR